jgi:fructosamine-3-kinase
MRDGAYLKASRTAPAAYFPWEAAGLTWLAAAEGGAPAVTVLEVGPGRLELAQLTSVAPSAAAAWQFGERLAATHLAGAPAFGAGPPGWAGDGFLGPLAEPLALALRPSPTWGAFWAEQRIAPMVAEALRRGRYDADDAALLDRVARRVATGAFDTDDPPARLHGDLWSGNVMWTPQGVTLIDPAAHGGHPETDLAMLALFGAPHLAEILAGYQSVRALAPGWRDRLAVHQLHPLLVHAVIFGGGYVAQSLATARRCQGH